jgi:hypothetical protein
MSIVTTDAPPYFGLVLDPVEAPTISNRQPLNLNSGPIRIDQAGLDWGDAAIQAFMAQQGRMGSAAVDYIVPNRTITIPLAVFTDELSKVTYDQAKNALASKVALLQQEGGVLRRTSSVGANTPVYADIVDAVLNFPDIWGETAAVEPNVRLTLTVLPDFYGAEILLDPVATAGGLSALLTQGGTNYCTNGSFEHDTTGAGAAGYSTTTGWCAAGATATVSTAQAVYGTKSLQVVTTAAVAAEGAGAVLGTPPGGVYKQGQPVTLTVQLRGNAGGETVALVLGATGDVALSNVTLTNAWAEYTLTWTPGLDHPAASVSFAVRTQSALVATWFMDGIQVTLGTATPPVYFDGDTLGYWVGAAGNSISVQTITNLVTDPSFEYDQQGAVPASTLWAQIALTAATLQAFAVSGAWAATGDQSLHCQYLKDGTSTQSSLGCVTPLANRFAVQPNAVYTASAVFNVVQAPLANASSGVRMGIYWYDSGGTQIGSTLFGTMMQTPTPGVYSPTLTATSPANAAAARVEARVLCNTPNRMVEAYIDDISFTAAVAGVTYFDGDTGGTWTGTPGASTSIAHAQIAGDYPARARIIVTDASGNDQRAVVGGFRSRYFDPAITADTVYEGEALTPMTGAASAALAGASGGSAMSVTGLPPNIWMPVLTTDLASGGPMTHKGTYRVMARVYTTVGDVPNGATPPVWIRFTWAVGGAVFQTINPQVELPGVKSFYLVDLGEVALQPAPIGTHYWRGSLQALAPSTGMDLWVDQLFFIPVGENSFFPTAPQVIVQGVNPLTAWDAYTTLASAAALNARVASLGGSWVTSGSATDFTGAPTPPGPCPSRATFSDASPRFAILGTATYTDTEVGCDIMTTGYTFSGGSGLVMGVVGRYTDNNNHLYCGYLRVNYQPVLALWIVIGGVATTIAAVGITQTPNQWLTVDLKVTPTGQAIAQLSYQGKSSTPLWKVSVFNSALAAGGTLASGKVGFVDENIAAAGGAGQQGTPTRYYDNFFARSAGATPNRDAVVFASQQSELRHDGFYRLDPSGVGATRVSRQQGDLPRLPVSGIEQRAVELTLKTSRGDLQTLADAGLDGYTAQVRYRPCWLVAQ